MSIKYKKTLSIYPIMDPYSNYKKKLEYYDYFEKQRENYIDLTKEDNVVSQFADMLFNKPKNNLGEDLFGILFDESMEPIDVFCTLIELVLYGINILTKNQYDLFKLDEPTDDMVYIIKTYLKSTGFDIEIHEEIIETNEINLYRDRDDYYCHITKRPAEFLCFKGWYVLNYRIIDNKKFQFNSMTPLEKFKAFFISNNKKIFTFSFKFVK